MKLQELAQQTAVQFKTAYGRDPQWIAAAPGRVNIIGEHTDYNDGYVFPMAIECYAIMAAAPAADGLDWIEIRDTSGAPTARIDLSRPITRGEPKWSNYPRGVVAGCLDRGMRLPGLNVLLNSNVPLGGGLSSSAALEVATATLLEAVAGTKLDPVEKALLCQKAEHEFAGMPCGIMDQFISVMGREDHLMLLDCRSRQTELVPFTDPAISVLITNTNVKHELTGSEYPTRRKQCETAAQILGVPSLRDATSILLERRRSGMEDIVFRRARHVISEIARTTKTATAIRSEDWASVGRHMYASHYSLKEDYEVSCGELDAIVEIMQALGPAGGVIGCRMTGAGFGGCTVALVRTEALEAIMQKLEAEYPQRTSVMPVMFVSRPAAGATLIKV